ncbi:hypothetical protein QJ48_22005 [Paenibacillus sp. A3]|nr:hypothetical protein QJ48_22005 [Paenibacillus sp. A3]
MISSKQIDIAWNTIIIIERGAYEVLIIKRWNRKRSGESFFKVTTYGLPRIQRVQLSKICSTLSN